MKCLTSLPVPTCMLNFSKDLPKAGEAELSSRLYSSRCLILPLMVSANLPGNRH